MENKEVVQGAVGEEVVTTEQAQTRNQRKIPKGKYHRSSPRQVKAWRFDADNMEKVEFLREHVSILGPVKAGQAEVDVADITLVLPNSETPAIVSIHTANDFNGLVGILSNGQIIHEGQYILYDPHMTTLWAVQEKYFLAHFPELRSGAQLREDAKERGVATPQEERTEKRRERKQGQADRKVETEIARLALRMTAVQVLDDESLTQEKKLEQIRDLLKNVSDPADFDLIIEVTEERLGIKLAAKRIRAQRKDVAATAKAVATKVKKELGLKGKNGRESAPARNRHKALAATAVNSALAAEGLMVEKVENPKPRKDALHVEVKSRFSLSEAQG